MASTIKTKNRTTDSTAPTTGDIVQGELAINFADEVLYSRDEANNIITLTTKKGTTSSALQIWDGTNWVENVNATVSAAGLATFTALQVSGAITASGGVLGNVTGNASGTSATVTGATQAAITTLANLVTTGALNSGSITSGFGSVDIGTSTLAAGNTNITGALAVTGNLAQSISTAGGNNNLSLRNTNAGATASTNINLGTDLSTATATITTFSEAHTNAGKLLIHTGANRDLVLGTNGADRVTIDGSTGGVTLSSDLDVSGVTKGGGAYSGDIPTTSGFNAGGTNVVGQSQFTAVGGAGGYGAGFGASSYAGAAQVAMGKIVWDGIAAWNGTAANQDSKARIFTAVNGVGTVAATFTGANTALAGALDVVGAIQADSSSSGDYVRMYGGSGTGKWDIYGNGANLRIGDNESAGLVQIDTAATIGGALDVTGQATLSGSLKMPNITSATGTNVLMKSGSLFALDSSSERFKGNIKPVEMDTSLIFNMVTKQFTINDDENQHTNIGWIAEETAIHCPNITRYDDDGIPLSWDMREALVMTVAELGKANSATEALETALYNALKRIEALEA